MSMTRLRLIFGSLLLLLLVLGIGWFVVRQIAMADYVETCMRGNEDLRAFCATEASRHAPVFQILARIAG